MSGPPAACCRRSRASAPPGRRCSCGRRRPSGRGCAPTWTTGPVPVPGGSACPRTREQLAALVPDDELARFAAALVRISLLPARADPLGDREHRGCDGVTGSAPIPGGPMTAWPPTEPTEVVLRAGHARLAIDLRGGGLRRLVVGDWEVLDGYPAGAVAGGSRGVVLLPWPNRVRDGRWTWAGPRPAARRPVPGAAERAARPGRRPAVDRARGGHRRRHRRERRSSRTPGTRSAWPRRSTTR